MRWILAVAALAFLTSATPAGESAVAPARVESDLEQARGLAHLRWFDMAERLIGKMPDKAEAALARAYLAFERAEAEADPLKRVRLCQESLARIADFEQAAPTGGRLSAEAAELKASVNRLLERSCDAALRGQISPEERQALTRLLDELRGTKHKVLAKAAADAEAIYTAASGDGVAKAFEAYVVASLNLFEAMLKDAEALDTGSDEQKKAGRRAADLIADWLKREGARARSPLPDEIGVQMAMNFAAGYAWDLAGEPEKACAEFDKVIAVDRPDLPRPLRLKRLWAICLKARALSGVAEKSGKPEDWRKALGVLAPDALTSDDPAVRVRARVLWARCLGKLGEANRAIEELNRLLDDIERMAPPFGVN